MQPGFEVRYLDIDWLAEGQPRSVRPAPAPLPVEPNGSRGFLVESTIFHDQYPWLGIRLGHQTRGIVPELVKASGQRSPLLRLDDPRDGGIWWVSSDGWDEVKKRHLSELQRSAGSYQVRLGEHDLQIENQLADVGRAEVQAYVDDFRGDLLWMILNDAAGATAKGGGGHPDAELASAMEALTKSSRRIMAAPSVAVMEILRLDPLSRVRATAATFRELARNPAARQLTGRAFRESADTPENRYLRHMLTLVLTRIDAWLMGTSRQSHFLGSLAGHETERAKQQRELNQRAVNPDMFDRQTEEIAKKLNDLRRLPNEDALKEGRPQKFPIRLERPYGQANAFFYKRMAAGRDADRQEVDFRVVVLPEQVFKLAQAAIPVCRDFIIAGWACSERKTTKTSGKTYLELTFEAVASIEPRTDVLEKRAEKRNRLQARDWIVSLSDAEKRELRREAAAADLRAKRAVLARDALASSVSVLRRARTNLAEVDSRLCSLGVSCSSTFPKGMLFVTNPVYASCIASFKKVEALFKRWGIGSELLEGVEQIGILHASDIYEKWSLLKVCALLVEDFQFEAEQAWIDKLVQSSLSGARNVVFRFFRKDLGLEVGVTYQAETPTGYRPDVVIRIASESSEGRRVDGLVLDAKFRSKWAPQQPRQVLGELVLAKGYGEVSDTSGVFILQPCRSTVWPPASPLAWGRDCDYGARKSHSEGWIQAGVSQSGIVVTEHIRRLLAMALQRYSPQPKSDDGGDVWTSSSFCLGCGEAHQSQQIRSKLTKGGGTSWLLDCAFCGTWTVRTWCYNCKAPLFKNGTRWTYHETLADQVTNVICPDCGSYFDDTSNEG